MRFGRIGLSFAIAVLYVAIRLCPALLITTFRHPLLSAILSIALTALAMLLQLALVVSIVRFKMKPMHAVLTLLASMIVWGALMLPGRHIGGQVLQIAASLTQDISLIVLAGTAGYLISFIVREPNILLPACVFAGLVDYWGVSRGPVQHYLTHAPRVIDQASVHMPKVVIGSIAVASTMGGGDFLFFALFMSVLYRFSLNVKGTFWLSYVLLTASMLAVILSRDLAIPALIPMGIAVLTMNVRQFKLKREELLATVYVGSGLLVALILIEVLRHRR